MINFASHWNWTLRTAEFRAGNRQDKVGDWYAMKGRVSEAKIVGKEFEISDYTLIKRLQ